MTKDIPAALEPLLPGYSQELNDTALGLVEASARLFGQVEANRALKREIEPIVLSMNSYYSNLIEGHRTLPLEIAQATRQANQDQIALSSAHVATQREIAGTIFPNLYGQDAIRQIHRVFYSQLPPGLRRGKYDSGKTYEVIPGDFRTDDVHVGEHVPPPHSSLPAFLHRFADYKSIASDRLSRVIAMAASHHRLAWIHPFFDGNGRVARILSDRLLQEIGIAGAGLWSLSRGIARSRKTYYKLLQAADQIRRSDLDGRGNLTASGLNDFCLYLLKTATDQVEFMGGLLRLDKLRERAERFLNSTHLAGRFTEDVKRLLWVAIDRGEFARGEAEAITGRSPSHARKVLGVTLAQGLLKSNSEKGAVRLGLPPVTWNYYFPELYPQDVLMAIEQTPPATVARPAVSLRRASDR